MLKKACVEAFVTAEARNKRMRENKWLRWKYIEELNQKDGWLDEQGGGDMGWAVGRRIYDKDEIEVKIWQKFSYLISFSSKGLGLIQLEINISLNLELFIVRIL